MTQRDTVLQALRETKLLGSLAGEQLAVLADIAQLRSAKRGQRLFEQAQPCEGMFVVRSGQVKVFRVSPEGKEHLLHMVRPGETFAEAALFGGLDYPASAQAAADCQLVFLPKGPVLRLLADHPSITLKLLAGMSIWLRRMVDLMEDLVLRDASGRIAKHLLSLRPATPQQAGPCRGEAKRSRDQSRIVRMTLKHQELAAHLGLTRETISRTLGHLETLGLITLLPKGQVRLKDSARLAELAGQ